MSGSLLGIIVHIQAFLMFVRGRAQGYLRDSLQSQTREQHRTTRKFPLLVSCRSKMIQVAISSFSFTFAKHIPTRFNISSVVQADLRTCLACTLISEAKSYLVRTQQVLSKYCLAMFSKYWLSIAQFRYSRYSVHGNMMWHGIFLGASNWGQLSTAFVLLAILTEKNPAMLTLWHCDIAVA